MVAAKTLGPSQVLEFMGITLDSTLMEACLPEDKLTHLRTLLASFKGRRSVRLVDLQSLIGTLQFACKVVVKLDFISLLCVTSTFCAGTAIPWWENYSVGKYSGASFITKGNTGFCITQLLPEFSLLYVLFSAPGWVALTSPWRGPPSHSHFLAFSAVANSHIRVLTSIAPALI